MNVLQRPREYEFCATMQDYIIDTDVTIRFSVQYGGRTVLDEDYVPDGNNQVRIRRLGKFCAMALWGVWPDGEHTLQTTAAGTFTFLINEVQDAQSFVMYSRMQTNKAGDLPAVLSEVNRKVTHPSVTEYASGERHAGGYILYGTDAEGAEKNKVVQVSGGDNAMLTVDVSYSRVCSLLEVDALQNYKVNFNGGTLEFLVDPTHYGQLWQFRFKNVYDMPEVLTATGGLTVSAADESDTALMWGVERKFGVKVTDEYTANSGVILLQSDYRLWRDMLHAQEVQVKAGENWLPIVITNMKYDRDFRRSNLKTVEFSFRLADDTQSNLMDV